MRNFCQGRNSSINVFVAAIASHLSSLPNLLLQLKTLPFGYFLSFLTGASPPQNLSPNIRVRPKEIIHDENANTVPITYSSKPLLGLSYLVQLGFVGV